LLNDNDIRGAKWILSNINSAEGDYEFTMDEVEIIHPFGIPFNDEAGANIISKYDFAAHRTLLGKSLEAVTSIFTSARNNSVGGSQLDSVVSSFQNQYNVQGMFSNYVNGYGGGDYSSY
jgi:hypothetical protein